jgi:hypothetical protein
MTYKVEYIDLITGEHTIRTECGHKLTEEHKRNIGKSHRHYQTEETKEKIRKSKLGHIVTEETKIKLSESHKGIYPSEETKRRMSEAKKGKPNHPQTEESNRKNSEAHKNKHPTKETKIKISESNIGKHNMNIEQKKRRSEISKSLWKNENYIKNCKAGQNKRPTSIEKLIIQLIKINNLPIRYTGDFDFWITFKNKKNKNPDFKVNHQKKVIEVWGEYYHKNEDPNALVKQYEEVGYKCLIIKIIGHQTEKNKKYIVEILNKFIGS